MAVTIADSFKTAVARAAETAQAPLDLKPTLLQIDLHHPHRERYRIKRDGIAQQASDYIEVDVLGRWATRCARRSDFPFALMTDDDNCPVHEKVYGTFEIELIDPAELHEQRQREAHRFFFGIPLLTRTP